MRELAHRISLAHNRPVPIYGKQILYDGLTGERFDQPVTVGIIHMLKLAHLVEDKVHARSTGPYSLVTQQRLAVRHNLVDNVSVKWKCGHWKPMVQPTPCRKCLTVKSDDVQGRVKTYEAIVKGEPIDEPGIPASFRVLVKELQSLGLAVEAITENGDTIRFGKDDERANKHRNNQKEGLLGLTSPSMPTISVE